MTECERTYTDRRAVGTRLLVVEIIAAFGWLLAGWQALAPVLLSVTWAAVAVACGTLTVAGWLL